VSEVIVPFADAKAKRAHDAADDDPLAAIKSILGALEGMENQIHGMLQIIADQDDRIRALEKAAKSKIIKVAP
jgi:hypothetical protein